MNILLIGDTYASNMLPPSKVSLDKFIIIQRRGNRQK